MIDRFTGLQGRDILIQALRLQFVIRDNEEIAGLVAEKADLREYAPGSIIIGQDSSDDCIHFILTGRVLIFVNGRNVASRNHTLHVGEMSMIDPGCRRTATVIAHEPTLTACVTNRDFRFIADKYPTMWRFLAMELSNRLRQRNQLITQPNLIPHIFFGSSKESLSIVRAICARLDPSTIVSIPWTEDVFWPSDSALEDLEAQLPLIDFAAVVFGPDDTIISRDTQCVGPRDNVLLELGMFLGAIGRKRTYYLKPKGMPIKIPSDIQGYLPIEYEYDAASGNLNITEACRELIRCINYYGPK